METTTRDIPGIEEDVEFYGYPEYVECGIGMCEVWGSLVTHAEMAVRCEKVYYDEKLYSEAENAIIKQYLNDFYGELATQLEEQYS